MSLRDPELQTFLWTVRDALSASDLSPDGRKAIDSIFAALDVSGLPGHGQARRLPVVDHSLPTALGTARRFGGTAARVADSFGAIEPTLAWAPRHSGGPNASINWPDGHANAMIVGPGGVERRADMQVGVSLMAPHVRYPDHNHAPEEVYLVLSPGRFRHGASDWFEPGIGGTLYNEPNVRHAMASDEAPLFAVWCLWTDTPAGN